MLLGLDISTSCTGWSLLDAGGTLNSMGYIILDSKKTLFQNAQTIKIEFAKIKKEHNVDSVFVEQNLQMFRAGFSSAKTIDKLAKFNGIISYIAFEVFEVNPLFINVNSARKALNMKLIKKSAGGKPTKEQVLDWVMSREPEYSWPTKVLKSGPRKNTEILIKECFDIADAYVISKAGCILK
jgi:hypothetical protein